LFNEILTWFIIAAGTYSFARPLVRLTSGRDKPEMTKPGARSRAWRDLRFSLVLIALGVSFLASGWKHGAARWPVGIYASVLLIWESGSWFRSRMRRKSGGQTAESS
jgi:hypothetical protein